MQKYEYRPKQRTDALMCYPVCLVISVTVGSFQKVDVMPKITRQGRLKYEEQILYSFTTSDVKRPTQEHFGLHTKMIVCRDKQKE